MTSSDKHQDDGTRDTRSRREQQQEAQASWLRYSHLGLQFVLTMGLCLWAGLWADERFRTEPWLTVTGALFGIGAATYLLIRAVSRPSPS